MWILPNFSGKIWTTYEINLIIICKKNNSFLGIVKPSIGATKTYAVNKKVWTHEFQS